MFRVLKVPLGALVFAGFYLGGAACGLIVLPLVSALSPTPESRIRRSQRVITASFRWTLAVLRAFRIFDFDPRAASAAVPSGPLVIIANHPSTLDVVAVLSVYRDACVVVKHKIWTDPLLRFLFRYCGHIAGGEGTLASNTHVLTLAKQRLAEGFPVVVFPEGGRSPARGLATLHKGAFAIATASRARILPLYIECDPPALHKDAPWHAFPEHPIRYRVHPMAVVETENRSARQLQASFTALYRERIFGRTPDPIAPESGSALVESIGPIEQEMP